MMNVTEELIQQVRTLNNEEKYTEVVELLSDKEYSNHELDEELGKALFLSGNWGKALSYIEKVLSAEPGNFFFLTYRGAIKIMQKKHNHAINDFTSAIKIDPTEATVYYNRGEAFAVMGSKDKAIKDFTKAIELKPDLKMAYMSRGIAFQDKEQHDKAIEDYNNVLILEPLEMEAYYKRACAWYAKKDYDKAIQDYTKAIMLDPEDDRAYEYRGCSWLRKNEHDKALRDFSIAIELAPDDAADIYFNRGNIWFIREEDDKAFADFSAAMRIDAKNGKHNREVYSNRAICISRRLETNYSLEDLRLAVSDFQTALRIDPRYEYAIVGLSALKDRFSGELKTAYKK